jgi:tetratricopeptide (TPR) repeat protein
LFDLPPRWVVLAITALNLRPFNDDNPWEEPIVRHLVLGMSVLVAALAADSNRAAQASWCAAYRSGANNCGFQTIEQCRATVSGIGGSCVPNYSDPQPAARRAPTASERADRPVRNTRTRTKPAHQEPTRQAIRPRPTPPPAPAEKTPTFASGDDDHIIPAEPEDSQPVQASISETNITPSAMAGERSSSFITARDLVLRGRYQAGLAALQNLNQDNDPDVAAYTGFAYSKLDRPADAKSWYEKALALDPNHLWALSYYGLLMVEEGNLRAARENLEKIKTVCGGVGCYAYGSLQAAIVNKR